MTNRQDSAHIGPAELGGSPTMCLKDGTTKTPDHCLFDPRIQRTTTSRTLPLHLTSQNAYPTIVIEVAFSETAKKLGLDCARWIGTTNCLVHLALGIDITAKTVKKTGERILEAITVSEWTVTNLIRNDPGSRDKCGIFRRTDRINDDDVGINDRKKLAKKYLYSTEMDSNGTIATLTIERSVEKVSYCINTSVDKSIYCRFKDIWPKHHRTP